MEQFNTLMMKKKKLLESSTEKNPIVVNIILNQLNSKNQFTI